jgi:hypothetical protein
VYGAIKSEGAVASVEEAAGACLREQEVVAAGGPEKRLAVGDVMEEEEEDGFPAPDDEDVFEADVGDEYAEMEEEEVMFVRTLPSAAESARTAAPAAAVALAASAAPIGVSTPAAASAVELSEEQKERIARNRQLAMQRLAEREAAKAAENAAALGGGGGDAIQPTAPSPLAAACSPAPSAPSSRYGSPRYTCIHVHALWCMRPIYSVCVLLSLALYVCLGHSRHSLAFSSQAID